MLNIQRALENDRLLRALTGLNRKAFDELCEVFGAVYQETLQQDPKPRQRARGVGRKARLQSVEAKKQENQEFSRQRVVCEHAHAGMKRYNAVSAIYRNRVPDFDDRLMLTAAGL